MTTTTSPTTSRCAQPKGSDQSGSIPPPPRSPIPLVHTSFWIEYRLWGLAPAGYHVTNILLHAAGAVLLWRILVLLSIPGSWLAAAIFAVHPVHVESVAVDHRAQERLVGRVLPRCDAHVPSRCARPATRRTERQAAAALRPGLDALPACAAEQTVTATLPAALLVLIAWKRQRMHARDIWPLLPLAVVGLIMAMGTVWLERHHVGAQGIDWQLSLVERCLIAGRALWFYAHELVWPTNLAFSYPRWQIDTADPVQIAYPLGVLATVVALWWARRKIGSGPLVAVLLFAGTLVPALGFVDVFPMRYSFVARDHFQYLASIALIALAVSASVRSGRSLAAHARPQRSRSRHDRRGGAGDPDLAAGSRLCGSRSIVEGHGPEVPDELDGPYEPRCVTGTPRGPERSRASLPRGRAAQSRLQHRPHQSGRPARESGQVPRGDSMVRTCAKPFGWILVRSSLTSAWEGRFCSTGNPTKPSTGYARP